MEAPIMNYNDDNNNINKKINEINSGRLIMVDKICPILNSKCIKEECNAFSFKKEIEIVSSDNLIKDNNVVNNISRTEELMLDDWHLEMSFINPRLMLPDEAIYVYTKILDHDIGRCNWGLQ